MNDIMKNKEFADRGRKMKFSSKALALLLALIMIFSTVPVNLFSAYAEDDTQNKEQRNEETTQTEGTAQSAENGSAQQTDGQQDAEYQNGNTYTIDGVVYSVNDGKAAVIGSTEDISENVVIRDHLGEFPVETIGYRAFYENLKIESVVIPETVSYCSDYCFYLCRNLKEIDMKCDYVFIDKNSFLNTAYVNNASNYINGLLLIGSCLYRCDKNLTGEIFLDENVTSVSPLALSSASKVRRITVCNPDCVFDKVFIFNDTVLAAPIGSTVQKFYENCNLDNVTFIEYCIHQLKTITGIGNLCDGSQGEVEGQWCDVCGKWILNHEERTDYRHTDKNDDGVCDLCGCDVGEMIIKIYKCGKDAYGALTSDYTFVVFGSGPMYDSLLNLPEWRNSKIKKVVIREGITSVGAYAFSGSSSYALSEVILPDSLVSIEKHAFYYNTKLSSINIPAGVTYIGNSAFYNCTSLKKAELSSSVAEISEHAFEKCSALEEVTICGEVVKIGAGAFEGTAYIKNSDNYKDGLLVSGSVLIACKTPSDGTVRLPKEITCVADNVFDSNVKKLIIENPDCVLSGKSIISKPDTKVYCYVGSAVEKFCKANDIEVSSICFHEDGFTTVPETPSLCCAQMGYTEGQWCDICKAWKSGHEENTYFIHTDDNNDGICDFCSLHTDEKITAAGFCGKTANWVLKDDGTLIIFGTGEMYNYTAVNNDYPDWYGNDKVKSIVIRDGIKRIGNYAFYKCTAQSVEFPLNTYCVLGKNAFEESELTAVDVPKNIYISNSYSAFKNCKKLAYANISFHNFLPDTIFSGCSSLVTCLTDEKLKSVGANAFYKCTSLEAVCAGEIETIGEYAFAYCDSLKTVELSCQSANSRAFTFCTSLENVRLNGCTYIGAHLFNNCAALEDFVVEEGVKKILACTFFKCTSLKNIYLPESVESIGGAAFYGCTGLETLTVENRDCTVSGNIYVTVNKKEVSCPAVENTVLLRGKTGSVIQIYADKNKIRFETIDGLEIDSIEIISLPKKTAFSVSTGERLSAEGSSVLVKYSDKTNVSISYGITVDDSAVDYETVGEYQAALVFLGNKAYFTVIIDEKTTGNVIDMPESLDVTLYFDSDESRLVRFVPNQTKEYTFVTNCNFTAYLLANGKMFPYETVNSNMYITMLMNEGEEYKFMFYSPVAGKSVYLRAVDKFDYELLEDGTYALTKYYGYFGIDNELTLPSQYNGKPVTQVSSDFQPYTYYIKNLVIPEGYTKICDNAFNNQYGPIYSLSLPSTLEYIGDSAFRYCSIKELVIPDSVKYIGAYAFASCQKLESVSLPENMDILNEGVFSGCKALETIELPKNLKAIEPVAFSGCKNLEAITIPDSVEKIGRLAFGNCALKTFAFPSGVKEIGTEVLLGCSHLKEVVLPDGITEITSSMFRGCGSLETFVFPETVTKIGSDAFRNCSSLKNVVFNDKLEAIGENAFSACDSIESYHFKSGLRNIGVNAFKWNSSLESVVFEDGIEEISSNAFDSCKKLKTVSLPKTLKTLGSYIFYENEALETVILKDGIEKIGGGAFSGCTSLKSIELPKTLSVIQASAFLNCSSLESITLPEKITSVEDSVFSNCTSLKKVKALGTLEKINSYAFFYCTSLSEFEIAEPFVGIIWHSAFTNCSSLESISLGAGTALYSKVFMDCPKLKSDNFNGELKLLGDSIFKRCSSIEKIEISADSHLSDFWSGVFDECSSLKELWFYADSTDELVNIGNIPKDVTIYALTGSGAQAYAQNNSLSFVSIGEVTPKEPPHEHSYTKTWTNTGKCNSYRMKLYVCGCGDSFERRFDYNDHIYYDEYTYDIPATVTTAGAKSRHCQCGKSRTDVTSIPAHKHEEIIDIPAVAPTVYSEGYTQQSHCLICGMVISKRMRIDPLEYELKITENTVVATKFLAATPKNNGENIVVTFYSTENNGVVSNVQETVIYKVGEVKLSKTRFDYNEKVQKPTVSVKDSKGNLLKNNTDYTVTYDNGCKNIGAYKVTVKFKGNYAGEKVLTYSITPSAVSSLKISSIKANSLTLSWKAVKGAKKYEIYKSMDGKSWSKAASTAQTNYTLKKLSAYKTYFFKVRAVSGDYYGGYSATQKATTALNTPSNIKASQTTSSITLTWSKVSDAAKYTVYMYNTKTEKYESKLTVTGLKATVKKLKAGTGYKFKLVAVDKSGKVKSAYSSAFSTATKCTAPSINVTSPSKNKVVVSWSKVSGATEYVVYYSSKKDSGYKKLGTTTDKSLTAKTFKSGALVYFKVVAVKKAGNNNIKSAYSAVKSVRVN